MWALGSQGDDYKSEKHVITKTNEDLVDNSNYYLVDIRELGEAPLAVSEGQDIHLMVQTCDEGELRRFFYGYDGDKETYSKIEDQEYDFDTDDSCLN